MGLRIAEISTLSRPVPPVGEGSVESLVSSITEGLVARGHEVTLFATADSQTSATLCSPVPRSYVDDPAKWDWQLYEAWQVCEAFRRHADFDIIHCHSYHHALLLCDLVPIPVLMSMHLEPGPDYVFLAERSRNRHLHFCSRYQARSFAHISGKSIILHGVPVAGALAAASEPRGHDLLFLGRFSSEKGVLDAIRIARRLGSRLLLAAPPNDYYHANVEKEVDGDQVVYVGEVHGVEKFRLLSRARALLYPVNRGEPFGLVLIEALLSGTPVLAHPLGAVPEVVTHGENGWLSESDEGFEAGLSFAQEADNEAIRAAAMSRYSDARMVDEIETLLLQLAGRGGDHA